MARKKFNVVTIAAMIAVLALGSLGLGYATWTDQLTINGSATAGKLDIVFANAAVDTDSDGSGPGTCTFGLSGDDKIITITAGNVYPGYVCKVTADVYNAGTLPAKVDSIAPYSNPSDGVWDVDGECLNPNEPIAVGQLRPCSLTVSLDSNAPDAYQGDVISSTVTFNLGINTAP
jgi:hypothetical protein